MSFQIVLTFAANIDITRTARWYEEQLAGLGEQFKKAVSAAVARAASNPHQFPLIRETPEVRRVLLHRFPYRVFFITDWIKILVFAVLHGARSDLLWLERVPKKK